MMKIIDLAARDTLCAPPFSFLLARRGRSRPRRARDQKPSRRPEPQRGSGRRDGRA
jgi:hypothetical protein